MRRWVCDFPQGAPLPILPRVRVGLGPAWQCPVGIRLARPRLKGPNRRVLEAQRSILEGRGPSQ